MGLSRSGFHLNSGTLSNIYGPGPKASPNYGHWRAMYRQTVFALPVNWFKDFLSKKKKAQERELGNRMSYGNLCITSQAGV